jgi:release factor glutamine methyltransferase
VADRIEFLEGDLLAPLRGKGLEGRVDFLASNPPYVPRSRPESVHREVREWEPAVALFGGDEGIDFYRRLLVEGLGFVRMGGYFVCEIGYTQLDSIRSLIDPGGWTLEEVTDDLQGIPRTLTLRKNDGL